MRDSHRYQFKNMDPNVNEKCQKLLQELDSDHNGELDFDKTSKILAEFRILTREKTINSETLDSKCVETLVDCSVNCHIEAQKSISNLVLNYAHIRKQLVSPYVDCVDKHIESVLSNTLNLRDKFETRKQQCEVLYYDLRIIFLLSALCPESRASIRDRLAESIIKVTLKEAEDFDQHSFLLVIESLKTLFNLTLDKCINAPLVTQMIKELFAIVGTEKDSIGTCESEKNSDTTNQLLVNLIHLLTNMPEQVYVELSEADVNKILNHLDEQSKTVSKQTFRDTVLPVLNVCTNVCKYNVSACHLWFNIIIGSTKEFDKRPEEYDNLRGRLVELMTSVDIHMKELAGEFLYALCGNDEEKLITYAGFGNSAAFLSSRGLLSGGNRGGKRTESIETDKDYQDLKSRLDPITGKLETPKRDPMAGMSEEEKERHAEELAGAITRLSSLGIIKPMGVNQDGEITELKQGGLYTDEPKENNNKGAE